MTDSIPLTTEQLASLNSTQSDWLQMTPDQERFIRATPPGHHCIFYGSEIIRLSEERLAAVMKEAFLEGMRAALADLDADALTADMQVDCNQPELGQSFIRVTVTDRHGRMASGIGQYADPRQH